MTRGFGAHARPGGGLGGTAGGRLLPGQPLPAPHRLCLVLVFAVLGLLAVRQVGSLDVGFHLKAGEFILERHAWPRTDPFTYTLDDHAYIDTSWGYQLIVAAIHRLGGVLGLELFHAALVVSVFALLYRTARLRPVDPSLLVVLLLLGVLACEMRFEARPELLSWLLLATVLHVLERRARGLPSPLWILPFVHLAWANLHGLFVLGWIATGAYVLGLAAADRRWDGPLLRVSLLSIAAPIVNPYGWRGVLFPFTLATRLDGRNAFAQSIGEFVSPFSLDLSDQFPFVPWTSLVAFWCFAAASALAVIRSPRGDRIRAWLLWLPFMCLAAKMIRNIPLPIVATLPLAAGTLAPAGVLVRPRRKAASGARRRVPPGRHARRVALAFCAWVCLVLGLRVINDAYYIATRRNDRFGFGWNRLALPVDAARFAVRMAPGGPVLNHLNFGGYLMWSLPEPVFIDGRLEVVGEAFYRAYRAALSSPGGLEALVARHGIRRLIFPYSIEAPLLGRVSLDPRWRLAYFDHLAAIFVRADPDESEPVAPIDAGPEPLVTLATLPGLGSTPRPGRLVRWLDGLVHRQDFPSDAYNRGLFHLFRNDLRRAAGEFSRAIAESGGLYYETYYNLGATLYRMGRTDDARACYRVVLDDRPDNAVALQRIGAGAPRATR